MSTTETITIVVLAAVVVLLSLWDLYALEKQPNGQATVSAVMRRGAKRAPILACAGGVLIGHFWWPNCQPCAGHSSKPSPAPVLGVP